MAESDDLQKAQALVNQLQVMKDEAQGIAQKITELDQERHEHTLVAETLEKFDSERKCFRLPYVSGCLYAINVVGCGGRGVTRRASSSATPSLTPPPSPMSSVSAARETPT